MVTLAVYGCEESTTKYVVVDEEPAAPQGVYSITGDGAVYLYWLELRESDLDHYRVYRSLNDDEYYFLGSCPAGREEYVDLEVANGITYYYAVTAVDRGGNESELSRETVFDTPRPEGRNLLLADFNRFPLDAGFDFSSRSVVSWSSINADIYVEKVDDVFFINVANDETDIQDMGFTDSFDEIGYAPTDPDGWSKVGWSEAIYGHTYIIWTSDNHYAKIWVTAIGSDYIRADWAYQIDGGNPELARPQHDNGFLRRTIKSELTK
jgi:hypothetical protein